MFKFISFGSGSSGNCYYLLNEQGGILIDTGVGTRSLKKHFHDYGLKFIDGFEAILVTHDHADHIKSVGSLCKKFDIPVYATKPVHDGMDKNYCMKSKIALKNRKFIGYGEQFSVAGFNVRSFHVPHDSSDNVGYEIEHDGIVFSLMTDVGHVTDDMKGVIKRSNYLVIEANYDPGMLAVGPYSQFLKNRISCGTGHLSNIQCAQALIDNHGTCLRHVWLCHLSEENNEPELARRTVAEACNEAGVFNGQLPIDVLRRKLPTGIFELV